MKYKEQTLQNGTHQRKEVTASEALRQLRIAASKELTKGT